MNLDKFTKHEIAVQNRQRDLMGPRYVGTSMGDLLAPEWAQQKILSYLQNPKHMLVYCGNAGIGKTFLCAALVEFALTKFHSFRYWHESDLLKRVRSSMDEFKGDYLETLKLLIDDELVMLDDIGSSGLNQWRKEIIFDAIDQRYCSMLPTIVTSNFTRKDFESEFHPRLVSRLFSYENTIIEIPNGIDLRLNKPLME